MTIQSMFRPFFAVIFLAGVFFCTCSRLDESTSLGGGIINDADPDRTNIDNHFQLVYFDTVFSAGAFSVCTPKDTGFGYHQVTGSAMVLGEANKEKSVGYFEIAVRHDSQGVFGTNRTFFPITPRHVRNCTFLRLKFYRTADDTSTATTLKVYCAAKGVNALTPNQGLYLGAVTIARDSLTDSLVFSMKRDSTGRLVDSLARLIFAAATSADTGTLKVDTFRFMVVDSINPAKHDTTAKFTGTISLSLRDSLIDSIAVYDSIKGTDTIRNYRDTVRKFVPTTKTYSSTKAWYIVEETGPQDSLNGLPLTSFASGRTAVFRFRADSLWKRVDSTSLILAAGFMIHNPNSIKTDSVITLRCVVTDSTRDGITLQKAFAASGVAVTMRAPVGPALPTDNFIDFTKTLNTMIKNKTRPAFLYLYMQTTAKLPWKPINVGQKPKLKVVITKP